MNKDIAIKVQNVSKIYNIYDKPIDRLKESISFFKRTYHKEFHALKDISLEIKKGETVGIVGKNGSGKSTLLKIITGVLTPTNGNVEVDGRISALLELGAGFNPELTGIENIYLNGTIMGFSKGEIDDRLDSILSFADIGDFVYQPVKMYSSGMFVRLAFAVAISVEPEILIIDEALSVGDVRFQQKCYSKIESIRNSGKTILFVSHSLESIKRYCSEAILLESGKVELRGNPKDVVNSYLRITRNMDLESNNKESKSIDIKGNPQNNDLFKLEESIWYNKNEYTYGTNEAIFTKVGMYDEYGNISTEFEIGKEVVLIVEFYAKKDLDELFFGFGLRNLQGLDLFVFNGTKQFDNWSINNIEKGRTYRIKIRQRVSLVPNDYCISLSLAKIHQEELIPVQIRYDVLLFKIIGSTRQYAGIFFMDTDIDILV